MYCDNINNSYSIIYFFSCDMLMRYANLKESSLSEHYNSNGLRIKSSWNVDF